MSLPPVSGFQLIYKLWDPLKKIFHGNITGRKEKNEDTQVEEKGTEGFLSHLHYCLAPPYYGIPERAPQNLENMV